MVYEGIIGIHQSLGGNGARFGVVFAPYTPKAESGACGVRRFDELRQVRAFLKALGIRKEQIVKALRQLLAGRSVQIPSVALSEEVVHRQGLDSTNLVNRRVS
jgi:hypothetical protein